MTPTICRDHPEITPDDWGRLEKTGHALMRGDVGFRGEARLALSSELPPYNGEAFMPVSTAFMVRVATLRLGRWVDCQTTDGWDRIHNRPLFAHLPVVVMVSPFPWLVCWEGRGPPPPVMAFGELVARGGA